MTIGTGYSPPERYRNLASSLTIWSKAGKMKSEKMCIRDSPTPVRGFTALAPQRIHFRKGVVADGGALWFGVLADIAITPRKRGSVLTRSESSDEQITVSSDCVNWLTL